MSKHTMDVLVQALPPGLHEKMRTHTIVAIVEDRKTMGWDKVLAELMTLPYCANFKSITKVNE